MALNNLLEGFKIMIIKLLNKFKKRMDEHSEKFNEQKI